MLSSVVCTLGSPFLGTLDAVLAAGDQNLCLKPNMLAHAVLRFLYAPSSNFVYKRFGQEQCR